MAEISYRRHRFPPVVIQHAVWWIFYGKRASATCNLLILLMRALIFA